MALTTAKRTLAAKGGELNVSEKENFSKIKAQQKKLPTKNTESTLSRPQMAPPSPSTASPNPATLLVMKKWPLYTAALVVLVVALVEFLNGRSPLGPDGRFGFWTADIWGAECSQRVADPYSFSHLGHGLIFYGFLWLVARRLPVATRFLLAVLIEGGWELLENSPLIINRYRAATMALGYEGDSILNSVSDILMMSLGFLFAWRMPVWASFALFAVMEIGCALWIHDNLTLNVVMLIHPIAAIKAWQMSLAPAH